MRAVRRAAMLLVAAGLFAWFVYHAGPRDIVTLVSNLGAAALLVALPYILVYVLDTAGWHYAFPAGAGRRLRFAAEFRIRMAGEAVNNIVPAAMLGGEPVKVYLASKRGVPMLTAAQSVVVAKTTMTLAQVLVIALGALAATRTLPEGSPTYRAMAITTAVAAGVVIALFWLQSRGMFGGLLELLRRLHIHVSALESREAHLRELDQTIVAFYRHDRARFFWSTFFHLAGWIAGLLEVMLVAHLVGVPIHWTQALAVEAFAGVAKGLGAFAPGSIGVQESGIIIVVRMLGLPDVLGVAYAVLRRGRELLYVVIGGVFLFAEDASFRSLRERVRAQTVDP